MKSSRHECHILLYSTSRPASKPDHTERETDKMFSQDKWEDPEFCSVAESQVIKMLGKEKGEESRQEVLQTNTIPDPFLAS